MDLRQLRYFVAVAEELSFTKAAARLNMSQPPLSQSISRLELDLGTVLFYRQKRHRPALTDAGKLLLGEARSILSRVDAVRDFVVSGGSVVPILKIGTISSVMSGLMPDVMRRFSDQAPGATVSAQEYWNESLTADELRAGGIDIAFARTNDLGHGIDVERLGDESFYAALPAQHRLAGNPSLHLADLAEENFGLFPRAGAPSLFDYTISLCERAGYKPRITSYCLNDLAMLSTVSCGLAITVMPFLSSRLKIPGVVFVPLADDWARVPLFLATPADRNHPHLGSFRSSVVQSLEALVSPQESLADVSPFRLNQPNRVLAASA